MGLTNATLMCLLLLVCGSALALADSVSVAVPEGKYAVRVGIWKGNESNCDLDGAEPSLETMDDVMTFWVDHPLDTCQSWKHFTNDEETEFNPNSAVQVQCIPGGISYLQYTTSDCSASEENPFGEYKEEFVEGCHQGIPRTIYLRIIDNSGCEQLAADLAAAAAAAANTEPLEEQEEQAEGEEIGAMSGDGVARLFLVGRDGTLSSTSSSAIIVASVCGTISIIALCVALVAVLSAQRRSAVACGNTFNRRVTTDILDAPGGVQQKGDSLC